MKEKSDNLIMIILVLSIISLGINIYRLDKKESYVEVLKF